MERLPDTRRSLRSRCALPDPRKRHRLDRRRPGDAPGDARARRPIRRSGALPGASADRATGQAVPVTRRNPGRPGAGRPSAGASADGAFHPAAGRWDAAGAAATRRCPGQRSCLGAGWPPPGVHGRPGPRYRRLGCRRRDGDRRPGCRAGCPRRARRRPAHSGRGSPVVTRRPVAPRARCTRRDRRRA